MLTKIEVPNLGLMINTYKRVNNVSLTPTYSTIYPKVDSIGVDFESKYHQCV